MQHASQVQFLESILVDLDSAEKLPQIKQKMSARIQQLQTGNTAVQLDSEHPASAAEDLRLPETSDEKPLRQQQQFADLAAGNTDTPVLTAIEHLAWGRSGSGCFPHRRCPCQHRRDSPELLSTNGGPFQIQGSVLEGIVHVPEASVARKLIDFHVSHLAWHHNCFHGEST